MNTHLTKILEKLSIRGAENTTKDILDLYEKKGNCIVHFLYFANIILNKLHREKYTSEKKESLQKALLSGDFLLPDGIALQLLYRKNFRKKLPNLNGTDFLPYFLAHIPKEKQGEILLYGATPEVVKKSAHHLEKTFHFPIISTQNGFGEFDWSQVPPKQEGVIRILLVARGTPLQETWVENNREEIEEMECLVFTVGGLFGFWAGAEKRAPLWARKAKIEWLYRALSDPKKNLKKTLVSLQLLRFLMKK